MKQAKLLLMLCMNLSNAFCKVPTKPPKVKHDNNTKMIIFGYTCLAVTLAVWHVGDYFVKQEEKRIKNLAQKNPLEVPSPENENIDDLTTIMKIQRKVTKEYNRRMSEDNFKEVDSILNDPISPLVSPKNNEKIDELFKESDNLHNKIDSLVANPDTPELLEMRSTSLSSGNTNLGFDVSGHQIKKMKHSNINSFLNENGFRYKAPVKISPTSPSLSKSRTSVSGTGLGLNLTSNNTNNEVMAKIEDNTPEVNLKDYLKPKTSYTYEVRKPIKIGGTSKSRKKQFFKAKKNDKIKIQLAQDDVIRVKHIEKTKFAYISFENAQELVNNKSIIKL